MDTIHKLLKDAHKGTLENVISIFFYFFLGGGDMLELNRTMKFIFLSGAPQFMYTLAACLLLELVGAILGLVFRNQVSCLKC